MSMFESFWGKKSSSKKEASEVVPPDPSSKFTLSHLRAVHAQLVKHKDDPASNDAVVVESLRMIAEMVVYGDKKSELLFDFFCEKNMLSLFLHIMRAPGCPNNVNIQILQTLSILCQCVRNNTSIYYLLSNNYINEIIDFPFDFEDDEGVRDDFISFMKSLSLRLNSQTVQFFFVEENDTFPLLSRAITFLRLGDPMARTAAQATILNVFRIEDDRARTFSLRDDVLQAFAAEIVFAFESQHSSMLALCLEYCGYTSHPKTRELTEGKVGSRIEDQLQVIGNGVEDWLFYLQDLFGLHIPKLTYVLTVQLVSQYIYPVVLDPFMRNQQWMFSDMFLQRKCESKRLSVENGIPQALGMDYFSKKSDVLLDRLSTDSDLEQKDDIPSELSREDSSVSLIVSFYLLNHILDIVREKRIQRSIMVALLHPFSQQQRKIVLSESRRSNERPFCIKEANVLSLFQVGFSPYRKALGQTIASERDRFSLLSCLLIQRFFAEDIAECHNRSKKKSCVEDIEEYARNALAPLSLLFFCSHCADQLPRAAEDEDASSNREEINACTSSREHEITESIADRVDSSDLKDHNDWLEGVKTSIAEGEDIREEDERSGSEHGDGDGGHGGGEDWSGGGRNGRAHGRSVDMNDGEEGGCEARGVQSGLENVIFDADGISVKGLSVLSRSLECVREQYDDLAREKSPSNPNFCGLDSNSVLDHVLGLFSSCSLHSLVLLQAASVLVYDLSCLVHYAHKPLPDSDVSHWSCPSDITRSKEAVLSALKPIASSLLTRANGWLSDTLLSQLEEEIRRSLGGEKHWAGVMSKVSRNLLLTLPPTAYISKRLGLDHTIPTSQVETSRREMQIFLLLRSLYLCLSRLSSSPFAASSPQDLSNSLVDEFINIFSEHGNSDVSYVVGTSIDWNERQEFTFPCCLVLPQLQASCSEAIATPPPKSSQGNSVSSSSPLTDALYSNGAKMKSKLSPIPKLVSSNIFKNDLEGRKIGEVVFVQDENSLLLAIPSEDKGGMNGNILLSVPLHRTDVVSDDDDSRNIKLLVRSPVPISSMVCLSSPDGSDGGYDRLKMASILPPRCPGVLYQMTIGFESKDVCDKVIQFIESRRLRIQSDRINSLREMLSAWVDK